MVCWVFTFRLSTLSYKDLAFEAGHLVHTERNVYADSTSLELFLAHDWLRTNNLTFLSDLIIIF